MPVQDVDRPDKNGTPPKMANIGEATKQATKDILPHIKIHTDDNIMSNVGIWATKEHPDQWSNGIFHNARYVIAAIKPAKGRYYDPQQDPNVTVEVTSRGLNVPKFRKYTGTPEKAVQKLKDYLQALKDLP
jgi:hypothetical protein